MALALLAEQVDKKFGKNCFNYAILTLLLHAFWFLNGFTPFHVLKCQNATLLFAISRSNHYSFPPLFRDF